MSINFLTGTKLILLNKLAWVMIPSWEVNRLCRSSSDRLSGFIVHRDLLPCVVPKDRRIVYLRMHNIA